MTIKDLASKIQGNVWITVETSEASGLYEKDGKLDAISSAHKLSENTLIEFQSQYWDKIKDDVIGLDVSGLRMVGIDSNSRHPGLLVYADVHHVHGTVVRDYADDKPIMEELLVETETELIDAMTDDSFDRIRLACNIDLANKLAVYDTTKTLDLAEHTLSIDDWNSPVIQVGEDADLTITGEGVVHGNAGSAVSVVDGGKVTLKDGAYICGTASDEIGTCVVCVLHGTAIINGGAFSNSDTNGKLLDVLGGLNGIIEVRGGKFVGQNPADYVMIDYMTGVEDVDGVPVYTVTAQR